MTLLIFWVVSVFLCFAFYSIVFTKFYSFSAWMEWSKESLGKGETFVKAISVIITFLIAPLIIAFIVCTVIRVLSRRID